MPLVIETKAETVERLKGEEIVQRMAGELRARRPEARLYHRNHVPDVDYAKRARRQYHKRGGTTRGYPAAVAAAVVALAFPVDEPPAYVLTTEARTWQVTAINTYELVALAWRLTARHHRIPTSFMIARHDAANATVSLHYRTGGRIETFTYRPA